MSQAPIELPDEGSGEVILHSDLIVLYRHGILCEIGPHEEPPVGYDCCKIA
jgi:hypothetical protein